MGSAKRVDLNSKEFVESVIGHKTHSVVIYHSHPCGTASSIDQDINLTNNIYHILEKIGIKLIDHIVLVHDGSYSIFENNQLKGL